MAYLYSWTGKSSTDFGNAANWYNESTGAPATTPPGASDEALISASGQITGVGDVYDLGLTGTGSGLTIAGQLSGTNFFTAGTSSVASGGSLIFSNVIGIGDDNSGGIVGQTPASLTIGAGGLLRSTLATTGAYGILVGYAGGTGTLTVTGSGALADAGARGFDMGDNGTAIVTITAGGHMTGGTGDTYQSGVAEQIGLGLGSPGGTGTLTVSGSGSGATFGDLVDVGFGGTGVLTVSAGGTLTAGDGELALNIGDQQGNANGQGTVTFNAGTGTLNGEVQVGAYGSGSLLLTGGASVTLKETANTGAVLDWSALVGVAAGASGTISVGTQSVLTTSHGLLIGEQGHGEFDVAGGTASLSSPTTGSDLALDAGFYAGASGVISVSAGLLQDVNGTGMVIGGSGSGTLTLGAGGHVLVGGGTTAGGLTAGQSSSGAGTVTVSGAGATLACAGQFQLGAQGHGTLSVSNGGSVSAGGSASGAGLILGADGGSGNATISGGSLSVTGQIAVGSDGSGTLMVSSGAGVSATSSIVSAMAIAGGQGSSGTVTVTGAGTTLTLTGGLTDGDYGNASFALTGGAHATIESSSANSVPGIVIGAFAGSGTMTVDGNGTRLNDVGQLLVGGTRNGSGGGSLTVSGGATLSVAAGSGQSVPDSVIGGGSGSPAAMVTVTGVGSDLSIANDLLVGDTSLGTLSVQNGAHVSALSLSVGGPSDSLIVGAAGSLITADSLQVGARGASSSVSIAGGTIAIAGNVGLHGTVAFSDGGTLASTASLDVAGATISGSGTLQASHIIDAGRIECKGGSMTCIGVITGRGLLSAGGDGTISILGRVASTVALDFGVNGTLSAASIADLAGTITGFGARDTLHFTGQAIASEAYSGHTLSLYDSAHELLGTEIFAGTYTMSSFALAGDGGSGTLLTYHR